jgi:hypothetical protein
MHVMATNVPQFAHRLNLDAKQKGKFRQWPRPRVFQLWRSFAELFCFEMSAMCLSGWLTDGKTGQPPNQARQQPKRESSGENVLVGGGGAPKAIDPWAACAKSSRQMLCRSISQAVHGDADSIPGVWRLHFLLRMSDAAG